LEDPAMTRHHFEQGFAQVEVPDEAELGFFDPH
jgi:hypothetical protein